MQDNFAFGNPLSAQYLSFNNVCFTGGNSLFCILKCACGDGGATVLPGAEMTAISALITLPHDYYSRL